MKSPILLAALCFAFAVPPLAQVDDRRAEIEKLVTALGKEPAAKGDEDSPDEYKTRPKLNQMALSQIRSASMGTDHTQLESVLGQMGPYLDSEALRQQCSQLAGELRADREAQQQEARQKIDDALKHAAETIRSAKTAADLDRTVQELSEFGDRTRNWQQNSPGDFAQTRKAETALEFAKGWQSYLLALEAGDPPASYSEILARLSNLAWMDAIPRSEILARQRVPTPPRESSSSPHGASRAKSNAPEQVDTQAAMEEILERVKTPEDLGAAIKSLEKLRRELTDGVPDDLRSTLQSLGTLDQAWQEFRAGLSTRVEVVAAQENFSRAARSLTTAIRAQIILLVLPRSLGLPEDTTPHAGEGPHAFLERVAGEALGRGDYLLAARARDTQHLLREGRNYAGPESSQAGLFTTAHNQETAGQFALAVTSYERALAVSSDLLPPKVIGERLAAIKAEHPQDFQAGMDQYLSPPPPAGYYPGGFDPFRRQAMQRGGGPPPVPPAPALAVPPAPVAPVAPPSPKP